MTARPTPHGEPVQRRLRILVAEDNADVAQTLQLLLETCGHEVRLAHTGPAALKSAHEDPPDALLCDIGLPGMNGYDIAKTLRGDKRFTSMLMLAVTGYDDPEHRQKARESGFDRHFSKTALPSEILVELERFQARGRLR